MKTIKKVRQKVSKPGKSRSFPSRDFEVFHDIFWKPKIEGRNNTVNLGNSTGAYVIRKNRVFAGDTRTDVRTETRHFWDVGDRTKRRPCGAQSEEITRKSGNHKIFGAQNVEILFWTVLQVFLELQVVFWICWRVGWPPHDGCKFWTGDRCWVQILNCRRATLGRPCKFWTPHPTNFQTKKLQMEFQRGVSAHS